MNSETSVIATKILLPRRHSEWIRRSRLLDFLDEHIDSKLTIIVAPAGYGKTSLLVEFAHHADIPVCWYSLDAFDRDPRVFLEHLIASVQHHFTSFGHRSLAALRNTANLQNNLYQVVAAIANELYELPDYYTLVLDDYHVVDESVQINEVVGLLLRYLGENGHLIVSSRVLPGIPNQALMASRGDLTGLSVDELAFTPEEIQILSKQIYQVELDEARAGTLGNTSRGWVTALHLLAQSDREGLRQGVIHGRSADTIYGYLAEQVLNHQPTQIQQFLLDSSVLDRLSPELCDALLDRNDSSSILSALEQQSLFITRLGSDEIWYTYHPLFGDFLRNRLKDLQATRFEALTLGAAHLYAARGEWEGAVKRYLRLGRWEEAALTIERIEHLLFEAGRIATLDTWIESLPASIMGHHPRLISLQGKLLVEHGLLDVAWSRYLEALAQFGPSGNQIDLITTRLRMAMLLRFQGYYLEALKFSQETLALLPAGQTGKELTLESVTAEDLTLEDLTASIIQDQGHCYYQLGNLEQAIACYERSLERFTAIRYRVQATETPLTNMGHLHHSLGIAYRAAGQLDRAYEQYQAALRIWDKTGNEGRRAHTLNSLGVLYHLRGEVDKATQCLNQALAEAHQAGALRVESYVLASLADLHKTQADYASALTCYQQSLTIARQAREGFTSLYAILGQGDVYRLLGEFAKAEELLKSAQVEAEQHASTYEIGLCQTAQGILSCEMGKLERARTLLNAALESQVNGGFSYETARLHLHLGQVEFLQGFLDKCLEHLGTAIQISNKRGYEYFLTVEGRRLQGLLHQGAQANQPWSTQARHVLERVKGINGAAFAESGGSVLSAGHRTLAFPGNQPESAELQIYALGKPHIQRKGTTLDIGREQVLALFYYLLAHHPHGVRKDELEEAFWGDMSPSKASGAFKITLYRLRQMLVPVSYSNGWYALELGSYWYDVEQFDAYLGLARQDSADTRAIRSGNQYMEALQKAVDLYHGEYLEHMDVPWVQAERARLRQSYLGALLNLARAYRDQNKYAEAVEIYRKTVEVDGYQEEAWQGLMSCYAHLGNRAEALSLYHKLVRLLRDDLALEPAPETQKLYDLILDMNL
ncbi:MAG: tetratricopeptide repeat protein [Chloroflexi bacterium]|nr:tetratricopeptide repeat protein [Chloroflexota bacterium]